MIYYYLSLIILCIPGRAAASDGAAERRRRLGVRPTRQRGVHALRTPAPHTSPPIHWKTKNSKL